jgi:hypothetical protein
MQDSAALVVPSMVNLMIVDEEPYISGIYLITQQQAKSIKGFTHHLM